jgi:hypothetical protein
MTSHYRFLVFALGLVILFHGCHVNKSPFPGERAAAPKVEPLVVAGFKPAISEGEGPGVVRSPLSGAVYVSGPVPQEAIEGMTTILFSRLMDRGLHELISPAQSKGVYSNIVSSDMISTDLEVDQKIGNAFSAEAVLTGYIYRWTEREGTDYAVDRPASVAFDLYLIRSSDGAILWKGRFDKTQQSLTENLWDMDMFLKGGGKWMKAARMAEIGLDGLLGDLFKVLEIQKD